MVGKFQDKAMLERILDGSDNNFIVEHLYDKMNEKKSGIFNVYMPIEWLGQLAYSAKNLCVRKKDLTCHRELKKQYVC